MKLEDMADFLDGLSGSLEKFLGKGALKDLHAVSECFRKFPGENVATFCSFVVQARDGKTSARRPATSIDSAKVDELAKSMQHYLDNVNAYDYATIRQMTQQAGKLKVGEILALGQRIGCHLTKSKKADLVSRLEHWLTSIKASADQSSFKLSRRRRVLIGDSSLMAGPQS